MSNNFGDLKMPTTKTENYTKEQTSQIVAAYTACGTNITEADHKKRSEVVKQRAADLGKNERSIRSKLVNEKVCIARAATSGVTGEKPEKKEVLAQRLVAASGLKITADSVEKMNKTDIQAFLTYFNDLVVEDMEVEAEAETAES